MAHRAWRERPCAVFVVAASVLSVGCVRETPSASETRPSVEPRPGRASPAPAAASEAPPPGRAPGEPSCLAGVWTREPSAAQPAAPSPCANCPKTTYELGAPEQGAFSVKEAGVVRRAGSARYAGDELVFELTSDQGVVEARFACRSVEACHRLSCTWSVGGAGESSLTK